MFIRKSVLRTGMPVIPEVRESRERLLADSRVARWYKNRGTRSTSDTYLANLELFLRRTDLRLGDLLEIARAQRNGDGNEGRFADVVLSWVEKERRAERPDAYSRRFGPRSARSSRA